VRVSLVKGGKFRATGRTTPASEQHFQPMRIIAGDLRGRVIKSTQTSMLRPTTDRVRETIFNILQARFPFDGARVLDLFAGTGALGIEALSRGAASCDFVESDRKAAGIITENITALALGDRSRLVSRDAMKFIAETDRSYDLIFADPPYAAPIFERLVRDIFSNGRLDGDGLFVLEHSAAMKSPRGDRFAVVKERSFGDSAITIYAWPAGDLADEVG
jgi:16S rRNA (guanine966-N2)-methyltransferase